MSDLERDELKVPYDLYDIFKRAKITIRNKIVDRRRAELTDGIVQMLPFYPLDYVKKGANNSIDIADDNFSAEKDGGRLILRIGVKTKTWYVVTANRKGGRAKMIRLGKYAYNKNGYYKDTKTDKIDEREANVQTARERFPEYIREHYNEHAVSRKQGAMTIREYLDSGQYQIDREKYPTERHGEVVAVKPKTIKTIKSQFAPWLDCQLHEVSKEWPLAFKKHWDDRYIEENEIGRRDNPEYVDKEVKPTTQRKYFSEIQSMFSICEKAGYIDRNWLKGGTKYFPKSKKKRGTTQVYTFEYEDLFEFLFNISEQGTDNGKMIIAIMAVTGCRNAEVYKNLRSNLELLKDKKGKEYFNLHIPAWLCKTSESGEGDAQIRHPYVVSKLKEHLKRDDVKNSRYIFPSPVQNKHCSDHAYRDLWKDCKEYFGLSEKSRLYSLRATLGTRISKVSGIHEAATQLRDSIETASLHYDQVDEERLSEGLDEVFEQNKTPKQEPINSAVALLINIEGLEIPSPIQKLFDMFKGRRLVDGNKISSADYDKFVELVRKQVEDKKVVDDEVELWLEFQ